MDQLGAKEAETADSKIVAGIRDLIGQELRKPSGSDQKSPADPEPSGSQFFWIIVFFANALILLTAVSDSIAKNAWFELFSKLFVSVFGGALLVYYGLVRSVLLAISKRFWFRASQACLLILLVILRIPIVAINPSVTPASAILY